MTRRRGGPTLIVVGDLVRQGLRRRSYLLLILVIASVVAAAIAIAGQSTLPYLIYPAL